VIGWDATETTSLRKIVVTSIYIQIQITQIN